MQLNVQKEVIVIGGGPAGLSAAVSLFKKGITDILIIEREDALGGILRQCIHDGFGLTRFKQSLSGPEYAQRFINEVEQLGIPYITKSSVISINPEKMVTVVSKDGVITYEAKAVILAMGCRERTRGALAIPGERPSGVYTAGVAQNYMNLCNVLVGNEIIILGSGDIGMIMARRFTLEGAHVKGVFEVLPHPSGLQRNIVQCLNDYNIPIYLNHTVVEIHGRSRLTGVTIAEVDENFMPVPGTRKKYDCDTLILSVGLIPENELSVEAGVSIDRRTKGAYVDENFQTSTDGVFSAGNVLHVHDLADNVSMEAERLAEGVERYLKYGMIEKCNIKITAGNGIGYTIPQFVSGEKDFIISFRIKKPMKDCTIIVRQKDEIITELKKKKAIPAEMIQIPIKKNFIKSATEIEVLVL